MAVRSHQKYIAAVQFLHNIIHLFKNIKIRLGKRRNTKLKTFTIVHQMDSNNNENVTYEFKPVQPGIFITTKSVIEITDFLLRRRITCLS